MFEVFVRAQFSAAHRLAEYRGNCARWHGHNWEVTVTVQAAALNELGLAVDFRDLKAALGDILSELDHSDLNQHPAFVGTNPSCEVLARHIFQGMAQRFQGPAATVVRVQVCETPTAGAVYFEGN